MAPDRESDRLFTEQKGMNQQCDSDAKPVKLAREFALHHTLAGPLFCQLVRSNEGKAEKVSETDRPT